MKDVEIENLFDHSTGSQLDEITHNSGIAHLPSSCISSLLALLIFLHFTLRHPVYSSKIKRICQRIQKFYFSSSRLVAA